MLTAKEKSELAILHNTDHHTAEQTERFNVLLMKSNATPRREPTEREKAFSQLRDEYHRKRNEDTWKRIHENFGGE